LLKTAALSALLALLAANAVGGAAADDLLVGSVRDGTGAAVDGAVVRAVDESGRAVGTGPVEADGTFAVLLAGIPKFIEIRCRYCRTQRVPVAGSSNVVVIVQRYAALESDTPSPNDLSALPYGKIADDLALVPFVVPGPDDTNVSDRSLAGGRGLIVDNGVPLVDYATGRSALVDFPDRYVQAISVAGPEHAFRYGSYAGGGIFALGPASGAASYGAFDAGGASALALEPAVASVHPAYGESNDDGTLARRADLGVSTAFAGGLLDASVGSAGEAFAPGDTSDAGSRSVDLLHVGYSTASRRYRSFVDFSAADVSLFDDPAQQSDYRSSYLSADVRLEHPGPVAVAIGALTTRQTAYALADVPLTGRSFDETSYVEARTGTAHAGMYAGLGLTDVTVLETLRGGPTDGARLALVPSFGGSIPLGSSGVYARAGYSQSLRVPTLLESETQLVPAPDGAPLERDELEESALGYDDGTRFRAEAIAYREDVRGFDERRQLGIGASFVWQVAPLVSLRAWTLRASPQDYYETYYGLPAEAQTSRQVTWASYANGAGLRLDAIAHREIGIGTSGIELDGDAYVPLTHFAALDLGTSRTFGIRHFYLGLRTR
jgi:hypothetical protein